MENKNDNKFEILSRLAISGIGEGNLDEVAETSLTLTSQYLGLVSASFFLWDDKGVVTTSVSTAIDENSGRTLKTLEKELFKDLRKKKKLMSAYMSFDTEPPTHSFTLPLKYKGKILGAVIGLQEGDKTIVSEEKFLETFSALISLNYAIGMSGGDVKLSKEAINKERTAAIVELAVTVNHEINNPLTAILGNVQLLLLKRDDLDSELKKKLKVIEESAMKIRDVTQKLLNLTNYNSIEYTKGTNMLDLSGED